MSIIAGQKRKKADYAELPATVSHSDYLQPIDVIVWAYIDCRKSKKDGWPVLSFEEIAQDLHVKKVTVTYAIKRLREAGFLTTTRKTSGNLMVLSDEADKYDTLRGEDVRYWTYVSKKLLTSGIPAQHIMVLIFLDRKKEARDSAWSSQEAIAQFLGKDIRTVRRIVAKLKELGLLEASPLPGKKIFQYVLFLREFGQELQSEVSYIEDSQTETEVSACEDTDSNHEGTYSDDLVKTSEYEVPDTDDEDDVEEETEFLFKVWIGICKAWQPLNSEKDLRNSLSELIGRAIKEIGSDLVEKIINAYSNECKEANRTPKIDELFEILKNHLSDSGK